MKLNAFILFVIISFSLLNSQQSSSELPTAIIPKKIKCINEAAIFTSKGKPESTTTSIPKLDTFPHISGAIKQGAPENSTSIIPKP